jgi:hypothetical protein
MTPTGAASVNSRGPTRAPRPWFVTSSLESGRRRQIKETAQRGPSALDPMGGMRETQCERAHKGSSKRTRGCRCAATPRRHWSGRPESNRRRPAWEFPYGRLTRCHRLSEFITCGAGPDPRISRPVTLPHGAWAASWGAGAARRVMPTPLLRSSRRRGARSHRPARHRALVHSR